MKRVHIIGRKNSGKTTLIVELVKHYFAQGYCVGTIKHTHHHHELDTPGKDSYRHSEAGAAAVGILSPGMSAVFWPSPLGGENVQRYDRLLSAFPECDLVLVEGDSQTDSAKVEVWRREIQEEPLAASDDSIRAVISDDPVQLAIPLWSRTDIAALATQLLDLAGE